MPSLFEALQHNREAILILAAKHGASNVRVFGSVARGEESAESDIDFLVAMEKGRSLFDQAKLITDLEEMFSRPCDVVTEGGLYHSLREHILSEAKPI